MTSQVIDPEQIRHNSDISRRERRVLIKGATMSDFDAIADAYIDMWNETDTTARRARIEQLFAPGGRYTDPLADVTGHIRSTR